MADYPGANGDKMRESGSLSLTKWWDHWDCSVDRPGSSVLGSRQCHHRGHRVPSPGPTHSLAPAVQRMVGAAVGVVFTVLILSTTRLRSR